MKHGSVYAVLKRSPSYSFSSLRGGPLDTPGGVGGGGGGEKRGLYSR